MFKIKLKSEQEIQDLWAYNKYWVMAKSPKIYNDIRQLFKNNQLADYTQKQFEYLLIEAKNLEISPNYLRVAYQHIWGYFKKIATKEEKAQYLYLSQLIEKEPLTLLIFLQELTAKYQVSYLMNSRIIKEGL